MQQNSPMRQNSRMCCFPCIPFSQIQSHSNKHGANISACSRFGFGGLGLQPPPGYGALAVPPPAPGSCPIQHFALTGSAVYARFTAGRVPRWGCMLV